MKIRCVYLSCIIALTMAAGVAGQMSQRTQPLPDDKSQAAQAEDAEAARKAQEQRALKLLDQVIAESSALRVPENRMHILAVGSSLLWPRDEKRARELLKTAAETLAGMIANVDLTDPAAMNELSQLFQTKSELFQAALNHDAAAALDFLRKTPMPEMASQEAQLELNAAWQLATQDPHTALQIAEQALANGATSNLPGIVSQLRLKDPSAAAQLANDILHKVQSEDLAANNQSFWLAMNMIQPAVQAAQPAANTDTSIHGSEGIMLSLSDLRPLINKVVSTSLSIAKTNFVVYGGEYQMAHSALSQIQSMLPQIEKIDPQLSAKLSGQISAALQMGPNASNPNAIFQNLVQNGTADDLTNAAESAPAGLREQYYQQAIWKAINQDDTDKATQIANDHLTNPMTRRQMLDQIEERSVWKSLNDGKVDEARALIGRLRSKEQRVQALVNLAGNVIAKGDKKKAAELLDEARAALPETPENYFQVSLLLNMTTHYSKAAPAQGIRILNGIAVLLSKLIPAGEALEGFDIQSTFKNGEILMQPRSQLGSTMIQFAEQLGNLATSDYADAIAAADNAGRPELRIMGDLSIASKLLTETAQYELDRPVVGRSSISLVQLRRQE